MRLVVMASGSGSNFQAIVEAVKYGRLKAKMLCLICDKPNAYVISRAKELGVPYHVVELKSYESKKEYEKEIVNILGDVNPDYICLAGYMKIIGETILKGYEGKIINIHPSLLPKYPGANSVALALENGEQEIGVTVHYVDKLIDHGEIIKQKSFSISGLTNEEVFEKLHKIEHEVYVDVLKQLSEGE